MPKPKPIAPKSAKPAQQKSKPLLKSITITGYKSVRQPTTMHLSGLNVIAGANSVGKSSFVQPLLLLKQTLEAGFDPGPLLLDGPHVRFTELSQFLSKSKRGQPAQLSIELGFFPDDDEAFDAIEYRFSKDPHNKHKLLVDANVLKSGSNQLVLNSEVTYRDLWNLLKQIGKVNENQGGSVVNGTRTHIGKIYLEKFSLTAIVKASIGDGSEGEFFEPVVINDGSRVRSTLRNLIHIPGLRGQPDRAYKSTAVGDRFPGTLDHYVASIIHAWQATNVTKLMELDSQLNQLGLTWKVAAENLDATRIELKVGRLPASNRGSAKDLVNIVDVGFGVSQVLPVLVGLLVAEPGQLVYIEQPEVHLHPNAQRALAVPFAAATKRGVQVLVETHSSIFLTAIQTLVAKGELSPDAVKLHWLSRDKHGDTQLTTHDLDEAGAYGDWPQDFDDIESEVATDYYTAAEKVLYK